MGNKISSYGFGAAGVFVLLMIFLRGGLLMGDSAGALSGFVTAKGSAMSIFL